MREIVTFGRYCKRHFKTKVKKIPLGLSGFTCPNIDGRVAKGGCTFCENESFAPNLAKTKRFFLNPHTKENPLLSQQLREITSQYGATAGYYRQKRYRKFIAYFQAFTNTYAPLSTLQKLYEHALAQPDCVGLSIGTRSDSVSEEILDYLAKLSKEYEIWIEYGIQSVFDETLQRINRGHNSENVREWIAKSKEKGLKVCGHVIFGLPGETQEMMLQTIETSVAWGIDSIKIHPLYVVKNTALAVDYMRGRFTPITQEAYIDTLLKAFAILPRDMIVQRLTAGIGDSTLLAPAWCANKNAQLAAIRRALASRGLLY